MQASNKIIARLMSALTLLSAVLTAEAQSIISTDLYPCANDVVEYTFTGACATDSWTIPGLDGVDYTVLTSESHRRIIRWKRTFTGTLTATCPGGPVATYVVNVNRAGPNVLAPVEPLTSVCQGTDFTDFKIVQQNNNATSYEWSSTAAESIEILNFTSARVHWKEAFSGTASIDLKAYGCGTSETTQSTFTILPAPPVANLNPVQFCDFEPVLLKGLTSVSNYKWYTPEGEFIGQNRDQTYKITRPGTHLFQFETVDNKNCVSVSKGTVSVVVSDNCGDDKLHRTTSHSYNYAPQSTEPILSSNTKSYYGWNGELLQTQSRSLSTGKILASETVPDQMGRSVVSSLVAPTEAAQFHYKHHFMLNGNGDRYDYEDFGLPLGSSVAGTVGWYYSAAYTADASHPKSGFPFSQTEYYRSDIGGVKRGGGVGETLRVGAGHEIYTGSFPVFSELTHYLQKQTELFPYSNQVGLLQNVVKDENGNYAITISSATGKVLVSALGGSASDALLTINNQITSSGDKTSPNYRPLTYFYLLEPQVVSFTGSNHFVVEDIVSEERKPQGQTFAGAGGVWPAGFYRIILDNANGLVNLGFTNHFKELSYTFYDGSGRAVCEVSPNGVIRLVNAVQGQTFADIDKASYKYDFKGQLIEKSEADAGTSKFLYRRDGKIRFSQNALQLQRGRFSYTEYDDIGRPKESGEYIGTAETFTGSTSKLEFADQPNPPYSASDKTDWVITNYDEVDPDLVTAWPNSPYQQSFVRGGVSTIRNVHSKVWYSYNEVGDVVWTAQKPTNLNLFFVTTYQYDFIGNTLRVSNFTYDWTSHALVNQFHHHYEYDADQRLSKAYTSLEQNGSKQLRATYFYYLHGPLKRIELGDQLQGVDFVYNIQGWLTQINHPLKSEDPGNDGNDAFGMILDYYESDIPNLLSKRVSPLNPFHRHGISETMIADNTYTQPLPRFTPVPPGQLTPNESILKRYSAESPVYKEMISTVNQSNTN